jgi:hypothetical protein
MLVRARVLAVVALICATGAARAATPKEIETAIRDGAAFLKKSGGDGKEKRDPDQIGATALVGLALLESGTPADDPVIKKITERIRDASYTQTQTYQLALCILYLDRYGDPGDRAIIQMLGVRLLAGQQPSGGWTYGCISPVPPATERALRTKLADATLTAGKGPAVPAPGVPAVGGTDNPPKLAGGGKLFAEVEKYRQGLLATEPRGRLREHDDNSNTQFGVLGVWVARKHGLPADHALDHIEKKFMAQQGSSGGWPYSGPGPGPDGSPAMTCSGLIGLATAIGMREERTLKAEASKPPLPVKKSDPAKPEVPPGTDPNDPFYNPPKPPEKKGDDQPAPKVAEPAKPKLTKLDTAIKHGMDHLADALAGRVVGKGPRAGAVDLYFLWSLERVGVIYGTDRIGKTDWYDYAADLIVRSQNQDGSWGGRGGYGADVDTSFALLVLSRSNLARDLSKKVQKNLNTELRADKNAPGFGERPEPAPGPKAPPADPPVKPEVPVKPDPPIKPDPARSDPPMKPVGTAPADIAADLFRATGTNWTTAIQRVRDAKGAENTSALLAVIPLLEGDRKKQAREALAERLCRMSAVTLRGMLKADDVELRRAAALACAMKDDKEHVPDLIVALEDKDADVGKAARAGLKSLTGKEFATVQEWRAWFEKQKK